MEWYSGLDNYRKHTIVDNIFTTELLDVPLHNFGSVQECFAAHLNGATLPVEVLYSGGLDSECVLYYCKSNNIPVIAVTLQLMFHGEVFNDIDVNYSKYFCDKHDITQKIYTLDIEKFYGNGDHIKYAEPYSISQYTGLTLYWLIEQCHNFPIIGGDYSWPQTNIGKKVYSPHRHCYNCYDKFMQDKGINGIGNMLSHSLDSNILFIKEHLNSYTDDSSFKLNLMHRLGFDKLEKRTRSHGWEKLTEIDFDYQYHYDNLVERFGSTSSVIKWNKTLADLLDSDPGHNDIF